MEAEMNNYEFWDELGKIFNAVVAYQEKSVEFNKRFINPWIRLGNVFDKQDRNNEAISSYQKAIELDPDDAQNWYELGNIYFRMENYDEAVKAYNKAIELASGSGWSYNNLALTFVTQGRYAEAIPLYQKSIELLLEDKDKAVAWNRLGNVYRKLNEYELAIQAFQKADELDEENAGFRDDLDEVPEAPSLVEGNGDESINQATGKTISPIELILAESRAEEAASANNSQETGQDADAAASEPQLETASLPSEGPGTEISAVAQQTETVSEEIPEPSMDAAVSTPLAVEIDLQIREDGLDEAGPSQSEAAALQGDQADGPASPDAEEQSLEIASEAITESDPARQPGDLSMPNEQTITVVVQNTVETYTDALAITNAATETSDVTLAADDAVEMSETEGPILVDSEQSLDIALDEPTSAPIEEAYMEEADNDEMTELDAAGTQVRPEAEEATAQEIIAAEEDIEASIDREDDNGPISEHIAYEEYLKDNNEPINIFAGEPVQDAADGQDTGARQGPVAQIDPSGELKIEVDTRNAHVWNELGNVYFNTGAFDDAVIAYSKAIELDRWFAWPYSNLALAYVQKGRFVESILLYQRSIELFSSEKDKAISWNRLGNVYRRLNDYENAIAAYQRADELDPDNTTLSLQSRFSLLGNFHMDQKPSYVS
jgi:tetratricopeptide (TPR) repeat protein